MLMVKDGGGFDQCLEVSPQISKFVYISSFESSSKYISSFWKHGVVTREWIWETDRISSESIIYYFL